MANPLQIPTLPGHDFALPPGLERLAEVAYNLWWSWTPRAAALFARIDSGTSDPSPNEWRLTAAVCGPAPQLAGLPPGVARSATTPVR